MFRARPGALVALSAEPSAPSEQTSPANATSPSERPVAMVPLPLTTVEQLASFHAELIAKPADKDDVRRRYGLAEPSVEQHVEAHWRARLARNGAEQRRYLQLLEQYVDWLRSQSKP
jgi:hypothetical protein